MGTKVCKPSECFTGAGKTRRNWISLQGDFFDDPSFGNGGIFERLEVESNGFPNISARLFQRISLGYAPREGRNENGVYTFVMIKAFDARNQNRR